MPRSKSKYGAAIAALIAVLFAVSCHAAEVYKCKGTKGELIYQNLPCPNGAKLIARGSYAPVPDDPRQAAAAAQEANRLHERDAMNQAAAQPQDTYYGAADGGAVSARVSQKQNDEYQATLKRWGKRMAGPPPADYVPPAPTARSQATTNFDAQRVTAASPTPPVYTTGCTQNSYSVHCTKSDGSVSFGNVDPYGNGSVRNADGSVERIRNDPYGHSKTDGGTCVKDIYGQCP